MLLVAVAQLVERRPVEANVAGSNPVSHPIQDFLQNGVLRRQPPYRPVWRDRYMGDFYLLVIRMIFFLL